MAGLRGPDSSEDEHRLDERAVFPETVDVNIRQLDPIPAPRAFLRELPLTEEMSDLVLRSRQEIRDVLHGRDDRLLVIVGPCSIHDPKAAREYAERLAAVNRELNDRLVIVMRTYFEKPRTTIGWKGLINDPDLDGRFNIRKGMWLARKVLTDVLSLGLPTAIEWLDPITPQYRRLHQGRGRLLLHVRVRTPFPVHQPGRSRHFRRNQGQPGLPSGAARLLPRPEL